MTRATSPWLQRGAFIASLRTRLRLLDREQSSVAHALFFGHSLRNHLIGYLPRFQRRLRFGFGFFASFLRFINTLIPDLERPRKCISA